MFPNLSDDDKQWRYISMGRCQTSTNSTRIDRLLRGHAVIILVHRTHNYLNKSEFRHSFGNLECLLRKLTSWVTVHLFGSYAESMSCFRKIATACCKLQKIFFFHLRQTTLLRYSLTFCFHPRQLPYGAIHKFFAFQSAIVWPARLTTRNGRAKQKS